MTIKIDKVNNKKEFIDEAYEIINYAKVLNKNTNIKIVGRKKKCIFSIIASLLYLIFTIIFSILYKDTIFYICIGVAIFALTINTARLIKHIKILNISNKKETNSILKIDKNEIELENKTNKTKYSINWQDIKYIIITKKSITFLPIIENNNFKNPIIIPIDYENKTIEALKQINKENLIIKG